jgi:hypothetical protein
VLICGGQVQEEEKGDARGAEEVGQVSGCSI